MTVVPEGVGVGVGGAQEGGNQGRQVVASVRGTENATQVRVVQACCAASAEVGKGEGGVGREG